MACGTPVIAADAPGINTVVRHGETGWLCGTSPESIRQAIQTVLADSELQRKLGEGARKYAMSRYALDKVVEMEFKMYGNVAEETRGHD
jgi:glycosyltransferase involved in cell wall biosynthesis